MLSAFLICGEYAMTRPASNALFLTVFSSKLFPWVWLGTIPLNLSVIYFYNKLLPKVGPIRFFLGFASFTVLMNLITALFYAQVPALLFIQFAWKDIYVLLMLKQLWSMIHSTISPTRAKYLYGVIYGIGTIGAICGSSVPANLASVIGAERILFLTLPSYLLLFFFYRGALRRSEITLEHFEKNLTEDPSPKEAFSLIRRTPTLMAILLLVIFMQSSVGLMEYQFNGQLELHIFEKDLRAAYFGKLMSWVNLFSLSLQFLGGGILLKALGLKRAHLFVPVLLSFSTILCLFNPSFATFSFAYVFLKGIEFSLFGVIREMLYIPLQLDAKFRAKAIIDVFAYRTSKGLIASSLLFIQFFVGAYSFRLASSLSLAVFIAWMITVRFLFQKNPELQTSL